MSMSAMIENMLVVQEKDQRLLAIEKQMTDEPARVNSLKEDCQLKEKILADTKEKQKQTVVSRNSMETEVGSLNEKINKCQGQLYQLKSNEEYRAMEKEIDGMIAKKSDMEDQIIQYMEDYDTVGKEVEEKQSVLAEAKAKLAEEEAKLKADIVKLAAEKDVMVKEIEELTKDVDERVYRVYKRTFTTKAGEAIVPIEDGICGGCHMLLPPNSLNEVMKAEGQNIVTCENCARILYYKEQ